MLNDEKFFDDPQRALRLSMGVYSPLWTTFIAAAGAGVAFWAWAQLARGKAQPEFAGQPDLSAPPAATEATPQAARPEAAPPVVEPANDLSTDVVTEAVAEQLDESLAIQAAPEAEPAPAKPARRKRAAPLIEAPHAHTVIEAVAPEPTAPPRAPRKARALATAAAVSPRKARAAKAAGETLPKRRTPPRKG